MRWQVERMADEYERRKLHGQLGVSGESSHWQRVNEFSGNALNEIRDAELRAQIEERVFTDSARRNSTSAAEDFSRTGVGKTMKTPLGVIATLAAVSTGHPVRLEIEEETVFSARTDVRAQRGEFQLSSPLLDTRFDFLGNAPVAPVPGQRPNERFRLTVGRTLPIWSIRSGVSYGTTTNLVSASLSKSLTDNLICTFVSSRPANSGRIDALIPGEESVSLNYQIRF